MADLAQRGLVTGNAHAGWTLTTLGEEVADACCVRWDEGEKDPKRQRLEGEDESEPAAAPEADGEERTGKQPRRQREQQSAKPRSAISAFAADFYDVGGSEDDGEVVVVDRTPPSASASSGSSSSSWSPAQSPAAASAAPASPASSSSSADVAKTALSGKDEKI